MPAAVPGKDSLLGTILLLRQPLAEGFPAAEVEAVPPTGDEAQTTSLFTSSSSLSSSDSDEADEPAEEINNESVKVMSWKKDDCRLSRETTFITFATCRYLTWTGSSQFPIDRCCCTQERRDKRPTLFSSFRPFRVL